MTVFTTIYILNNNKQKILKHEKVDFYSLRSYVV